MVREVCYLHDIFNGVYSCLYLPREEVPVYHSGGSFNLWHLCNRFHTGCTAVYSCTCKWIQLYANTQQLCVSSKSKKDVFSILFPDPPAAPPSRSHPFLLISLHYLINHFYSSHLVLLTLRQCIFYEQSNFFTKQCKS